MAIKCSFRKHPMPGAESCLRASISRRNTSLLELLRCTLYINLGIRQRCDVLLPCWMLVPKLLDNSLIIMIAQSV